MGATRVGSHVERLTAALGVSLAVLWIAGLAIGGEIYPSVVFPSFGSVPTTDLTTTTVRVEVEAAGIVEEVPLDLLFAGIPSSQWPLIIGDTISHINDPEVESWLLGLASKATGKCAERVLVTWASDTDTKSAVAHDLVCR